jgi:CheY-like chemotaxis protein
MAKIPVQIRLSDSSALESAKKALENDCLLGSPNPKVIITDFIAEDAQSVKEMQTASLESNPPKFIFILPKDREPSIPELLLAFNEGAKAALPASFNPESLLHYVKKSAFSIRQSSAGWTHEHEQFSEEYGHAIKKAHTAAAETQSLSIRLSSAEKLLAALLSGKVSQDRRVLIISDSVYQRELLEHMFKEHGFDTKTASCGKEAEDIALQERIRIIVSDMELPDTDGAALCKTLKIERKLIPCHFIICTANIAKAQKALTPGSGVDECIEKSAEPSWQTTLLSRAALGLLL